MLPIAESDSRRASWILPFFQYRIAHKQLAGTALQTAGIIKMNIAACIQFKESCRACIEEYEKALPIRGAG
ncbi:hypothetical protein OI70_19095 [Dickeya fangzhongdai]|nr:hypothetical protein OI70_19095 [Dickeya fangzhongdai]